jgi:hypothetical protein
MSGDESQKTKAKVMDTQEEKETDKTKDEKPTDLHHMKKRVKKVIYYEIDSSSSPSTSSSGESSSKRHHQHKTIKSNFNRTAFNYYRIPKNLHAQLLVVPLGKLPHFDGLDYSWWSHKMKSHLLSHPVLEGKPNANHIRVRISNSRTQQLHNWTSSHSAKLMT